MKKITTTTLSDMKKRGEKIVALTAYDAPTAKILNEIGVDVILVGDSVSNVKLGYENTIPVTVEEMLHHIRAVKRGNSSALLVGDMPYLSYQLSIEEAKHNAARFIKEGGAEAIKLEGGREILPVIQTLLGLNIPVMGHLGLTPQAIYKFGGYKIQGRSPQAQEKMIQDARALEKAGVFAIVLECIPNELAKEITNQVSLPTIGIGAGPDCDGQILVIDDLLGLSPDPIPKFVKQYAHLRQEMIRALQQFQNDVRNKKFPSLPTDSGMVSPKDSIKKSDRAH